MPDQQTNGHEDADEAPTANRDFDTGFRLALAAQLGHSGFDDRDRYEVFGWETDPDDEEFLALYLRNGYAKAIVDLPAQTTWRHPPTVHDGDPESEFAEAVETLAQATDLWSYCARADRVAGVGEHGLLVINYDDVSDPDGLANEVNLDEPSLDSVKGYRPFFQTQIEDIDYGDVGTERWGLPTSYSIDLGDDVDDEAESDDRVIEVHHSRVIDIPSTRPLEDDTRARPRVEPVLNNIYDIEKTLGAVAEAAYTSANADLWLNADPTQVDTSSQGMDDLKTELQRYLHHGQPYFRTSGMDVERLSGEVQDPSGIIDAEVSVIAATKGIPKRMLTGEAAGEIASSETDMRQWFGKISERQSQYAEPHIAHAVLRRHVRHGVLPQPNGGTMESDWPDLFELSDEEQANIMSTRSTVVKNVETAVPDLRGERAEQFIATGVFPSRDDGETTVDEADPAVQEAFATFNGQD